MRRTRCSSAPCRLRARRGGAGAEGRSRRHAAAAGGDGRRAGGRRRRGGDGGGAARQRGGRAARGGRPRAGGGRAAGGAQRGPGGHGRDGAVAQRATAAEEAAGHVRRGLRSAAGERRRAASRVAEHVGSVGGARRRLPVEDQLRGGAQLGADGGGAVWRGRRTERDGQAARLSARVHAWLAVKERAPFTRAFWNVARALCRNKATWRLRACVIAGRVAADVTRAVVDWCASHSRCRLMRARRRMRCACGHCHPDTVMEQHDAPKSPSV
ncbi:hypothetical protein FGB62_11g211 [Gracilaria domingensis]|nr:hypothetical protein FGB62_11g211 [Gracilaria domingensis]